MSSVIKAPAGADLEFVAGAGKSVKFTTGAGSVDITALATQGFVTGEINNVIGAAPGALNTLKELADALGSDASFSTTITNALATKAAASDVYTKTAADTLLSGKANTATTLAGYGITDVHTKTEVNTALGLKADATAVYTKTEIDTDWYTADETDTAITNNNINFVNTGLATKQDKFVDAPTSSIGQDGDLEGMIATDSAFIYRCVANFDGTSNIWARVALTLSTW